MSGAEKIYYGLMALAMVVGVLTSPFFYARSIQFLNRRWQNQQKQTHLPPSDKPIKTQDNADDSAS